MAVSSLRLRRILTLTPSPLTRFHHSLSSLHRSPILQSQTPSSLLSTTIIPQNPTKSYLKTQFLWFRSSPLCLSSRISYNNDDEKITPDTILFEGCDYNHWLITMDFPKDPKPTSEEMVETYVQTLAKVVGSVEEAKKRMYACSTTTYTGFQAVMTEEMSEKFKGLPGVVFILPDSYIDPVNKEYGGDKYINGTIIPRPPPVQYGRQGRYGDRNRNRQGPPQGDGRNYGGARQNYEPPQNIGPSPSAPGDGRSHGGAQQNYGPPQSFGPSPPAPAGDGRSYVGAHQNYGPPQNFGVNPPTPGDGRNYGGAQHNYGPPPNFGPAVPGDGRNYGPQQNYPPQRNLGSYPTGQGDGRSVGAQQNYCPSPAGQTPVGNRDYVPERRDSYHNERSGPLPSYQRDFPQASGGGYAYPMNSDIRGDRRSIDPPAGDFSQAAGPNYGQSNSVHGEGQMFPRGNGRQ